MSCTLSNWNNVFAELYRCLIIAFFCSLLSLNAGSSSSPQSNLGVCCQLCCDLITLSTCSAQYPMFRQSSITCPFLIVMFMYLTLARKTRRSSCSELCFITWQDAKNNRKYKSTALFVWGDHIDLQQRYFWSNTIMMKKDGGLAL